MFKRIFIFCFRLARQRVVTLAIQIRNIKFAFKVLLHVKNWKDYYQNFFFEPKEESAVYELKNGLKFNTRTKTSDKGIFVELTLGDEYLIDDIELPKDSTVLDIGGQIGVFSVYIAERAGRVFSFEPVPGNFQMLKENIRLNKLEKKIIPFNLAVSDKKGKEKIFLHNENSGAHSIYYKGKEFVEAKTTTLKDIFLEKNIEKCDLIKMDIEGAEYGVLYNLDEKIFIKIERIAMECHELNNEKMNWKHMKKFLESKGYKVKFRTSLCAYTILLAKKIH